ncbi:hypothetical protein J6590_037316 [Homalodisca vitripennis]|nr:hypothetical protein J6590_037316 [Homalodisca vitripennis]
MVVSKRMDIQCSNCGTCTPPSGDTLLSKWCTMFVISPATMQQYVNSAASYRLMMEARKISRGNSSSEECEDILVAQRRQIQPHLMLAVLQQTINFQRPTASPPPVVTPVRNFTQ